MRASGGLSPTMLLIRLMIGALAVHRVPHQAITFLGLLCWVPAKRSACVLRASGPGQ